MFDSLHPNYKMGSVLEISPEMLENKGIKLLLLDLDNTLSPYYHSKPLEGLKKWSDNMLDNGIILAIVSNNKKERAKVFAETFSMDYYLNAKKPKTDGIQAMMEKYNMSKTQTAIAGDQIFKDIIAANRAGIFSFLVEPIAFNNPLFALRYLFEIPFRTEKKNG